MVAPVVPNDRALERLLSAYGDAERAWQRAKRGPRGLQNAACSVVDARRCEIREYLARQYMPRPQPAYLTIAECFAAEPALERTIDELVELGRPCFPTAAVDVALKDDPESGAQQVVVRFCADHRPEVARCSLAWLNRAWRAAHPDAPYPGRLLYTVGFLAPRDTAGSA
jgi:hypothetical protein